MKVAVPLAKNIWWGITAAASAIDAGIQKTKQNKQTKKNMVQEQP